MTFRRNLAALSAAVLLAVFAASAAWADTKPTPLRVLVLEGESITISLRSNPTTGYQWTMQPLKPNSVVSIDKGIYVRPQSNLAGAPGWMVYNAKANDQGLTTLTFQYARSFEKDVPPIRTFSVVVRCNPRTSAAKTATQVFYCQPDDTFQFALPCPTDGFTWNMVDKSYDGGVLLSLGRIFVPAPPAVKGKPTPRASTIQRFKAVGVGDTTAILMYEKPGVEQAAVNTTAVRVAK